MRDKAKWRVISIGVFLIVSFFVGLFGGMENYGGIGWGLLGIAITILIAFSFGIAFIAQKKNIKGIFIGILIILVLIPLVFAGTCALSVGGYYVRRLFVK